jgi:hypothetical protein
MSLPVIPKVCRRGFSFHLPDGLIRFPPVITRAQNSTVGGALTRPEQQRRPFTIIGKIDGLERESETEHFDVCPACGQAFAAAISARSCTTWMTGTNRSSALPPDGRWRRPHAGGGARR